jgi:DNA-binding MarR family transcriptional regulator
VSRALNIKPPSAKWHLDKLVENNFINMRKTYGKTVFYPSNMIDDDDVELLAMLNDEHIKLTFLCIRDNPGITQKKLSNLLKTSHQTVILHASRLERLGFIASIEDGKFRRYYPTNKIQRKSEAYLKRIREFREHILKTLKKDGVKPRLIRSTDKGIIIEITVGQDRAVLELSTRPFVTVIGG